MATTTHKRRHSEALDDAYAFRNLFSELCWRQWTIAGSLRRERPEVGDVEHVVLPAFGEVPLAGSLFTAAETVNLLWHRLDALLAEGVVSKHVYGQTETGAPLYRWGNTYRGVDFRGFNHELFCADDDNYGAILTIRTGPADFSQRFVTKLKDGGMYRQQEGRVIHVRSGEPVRVPDEETYFKLAGMEFIEPSRRA